MWSVIVLFYNGEKNQNMQLAEACTNPYYDSANLRIFMFSFPLMAAFSIRR